MSFGASVGDFIAVPTLAWRVYRACRDSSSDFAGLSNEVLSMHAALEDVGDYVNRHKLGPERVTRLALIGNGCNDVLKALQLTLAGYESLKSKSKGLKERCKRIRDRLRWAMETVGDFRIRLVTHTNMLTLFLTSITISSQTVVEADVAQVLQHVAHLTIAHQNPVMTSIDRPKSPGPEDQPIGVALSCWGCKVLRKPCAPGRPCPSCLVSQSRLCHLPCRRGPLKHLARELTPSPFWPSEGAYKHLRSTGMDDDFLALGTAHRTYSTLNLVEMLDSALSAVSKSEQAFDLEKIIQQSCPVGCRFGADLLIIAFRYCQYSKQTTRIVAQAIHLMLMAFLIIGIKLPVMNFLHRESKTITFWYGQDEERCLIKLKSSLEDVLADLETLLIRRDRREWASACFALCLIFFSAELMQLNIHSMHPSSTASSMCEAMKMNFILPLAELFSASTAGFHPLDLDWELEENATLVDNNHQIIDSLQRLQSLTQEHTTFLEQSKQTEYVYREEDYLYREEDYLLGRLAAEILI